MSNVQPIRSPADPLVVERLERLLEMAKTGEIKGFVFVADTVFKDEGPTNYSVCRFKDNLRLLGAIEYAKGYILEVIRQGNPE